MVRVERDEGRLRGGVGRVANVRNVGEQPGDPQLLVEKSYTNELIVPGR